ncbi:MAG: hypothetical protein ACR2K2_07485 [Mycobacteriales bacterium]
MPTIAESLYDVLLRQGPCTEEELRQELVRTGRSTAKTTAGVKSALADHPYARPLPDGRWDTGARALAGAVLTTRPRSRLRDGVLWVHRDLEPFDALHGREGIRLAAGGVARRGSTRVPTIVGPDGWLPAVEPGQLLALTWDGKAMSVELATDVLTVDSDEVLAVRRLLRAHAEAVVQPPPWQLSRPPSMSTTVLSALQEQPDLFGRPLPPLSELLPLPEHLLPEGWVGDTPPDGVPLMLQLPQRVFHELERRSHLLGDRLPDYAGMLLGAAVDRVLPPARDGDCGCRWGPAPSYGQTYGTDLLDDDEDGVVVRPSTWGR